MSTRGDLFAGLTVALVTPFRNGEIDFDDLGRLVDWHVAQGTDTLAPPPPLGVDAAFGHQDDLVWLWSGGLLGIDAAAGTIRYRLE